MTTKTPIEGGNALRAAKGIEEFNSPTAEPDAAVSRNWADLSEDILSPVLSFGEAPTSADRAQGQEIQSSGAVLWVADENAATDLADQASDLAPAVNIPEEVLAEVVSRDLGQGEEEDQNRPAVSSILSEQV